MTIDKLKEKLAKLEKEREDYYNSAQINLSKFNGAVAVLEEMIKEEEEAQALESAWINLREQRDNLLAKCDWTQLPDAPVTDEKKKEWKIYRQSLRDLTNNLENPISVVWPVSPTKD